MSKKIPVGVFVFVLIAAVLATFMTTYVLVNDVPTVPIKSSSSVYTEEQQKLLCSASWGADGSKMDR